MGLFTKKPGGTLFGNLLRTGVSAAQKSIGMPQVFGTGKGILQPSVPTTSAITTGTTWNDNPGNILGGVSVSSVKPADNNMLLYIVGAVAAYFLLSSNKR